MMRIFTVCIAFGLLALPAQACPLLSAEKLSKIAKITSPLQQLSQVPNRCHYQWSKANATEIEAENAQALRNAMRRGQQPYQRQNTWSEVKIELRSQYADSNQAQSSFRQLLAGQIPERFGSPDALSGSRFELLKPDIAWDKTQRLLMIRKGNAIWLLQLNVHDQTDKDKALALQLVS